MAYGIVWCWECWVRKRQAYPPPLKGIPSQRFSSLSNLWASGLPKMLDGKILCVFYHQRVTCQHQCAQRKVLTHNAQSGNQSCISRDFSIQNKTVKKKLTGLRYLLDRPAIHIGWTPGQGCGKLLAVAMPKSPCDFFCNFCMSWSSLRPSQEISSPRNKVPCNSGVKAPWCSEVSKSLAANCVLPKTDS